LLDLILEESGASESCNLIHAIALKDVMISDF